MRKYLKVLIMIGVLAAAGPVDSGFAQDRSGVQRVADYLSGSRLLVSYREGGPVYGTHFFLEIHYCSSGSFVLFGRSERQTVLDNWQVSNWEEYGRWTVVPHQGRVGIQYVSSTGKRDVVAVDLLPDGRLWVSEGISVQRQGPAQC